MSMSNMGSTGNIIITGFNVYKAGVERSESGESESTKGTLNFDGRFSVAVRGVAVVLALVVTWLAGPVNAFAALRPTRPLMSRLAAKGLTQTPGVEMLHKMEAREKTERNKPRPAVRELSRAEMQHLHGSGPYRVSERAGALMPWQKSFRDVNLATGNLFKSFTDVQVSPARGAGLVLQRTYSSQDDRVGPFGIGWTHAYDIRMDEAGVNPETDAEEVPRTDFFGGKHTYTRDADGLYTPPAYLFDEMDSKYDAFLASGPSAPVEDTQKGMDGTVKHFVANGTTADGKPNYKERVCDYIEDRHGNRTTLTYGQTMTPADGGTRKLLTEVKDPSNRTLTFAWTNFGTMSQPAYRITQVQGPVYRVTYQYYTNTSDSASYLNLWKVHLDSDGLDRITTYTYTSFSGGDGTANGLLSSIVDPLDNTMSYQYGKVTHNAGYSSGQYDYVWVTQVTEPAGVNASGTPRQLLWTLDTEGGSSDGGSHVIIYNAAVPDPIPAIDQYRFEVDFDGRSRITGLYMGLSDDNSSRADNYFYDDANNVTAVSEGVVGIDVLGSFSGSYNYSEMTYGPHGNVVTSQAGKDGSIYSPSCYPAIVTEYYDASKYFQKKSVTDQKGHTTTFDYYDDQDESIGNRGEVKWVRDARYATTGKQFTYTYNQYGQKLSETNLRDVVTAYTYDPSVGNLTQVVQDPDNTALGYTGLKRTTQMSYDASGRVLSSTDPNNQTSNFTYNSIGQPLSATFAPTSNGNNPGETVTYTYGANGRTESVSDNRGLTTMAYETGCDRVHSVADPITGTMAYTYLTTGERETMTLPGGGVWTYSYLPAALGGNGEYSRPGEMLSKGDDPNSISHLLKRIVDDAGRIVDLQVGFDGRLYTIRFNQAFPQNSTAPSQYCQTYFQYNDQYSQVGYSWQEAHSPGMKTLHSTTTYWNQSSQTNSPQLISKNQYLYDDIGQRVSNTISWTGVGGTVQSRTEQYGYDELNRLTGVNYGDGQTQSYAFDAMGNRTSKSDSANGNEGYAFDAANRLTQRTVGTTSATYVSDANGNTLSSRMPTGNGVSNFNTVEASSWDSQNRLVKQYSYASTATQILNPPTTTFTYGADGLRRSKTFGYQSQTKYVYDGQSMVQEQVGSGLGFSSVSTNTYLQGPQGSLYRKSSTAADPTWYVYDGLGSVVGEVGVTGSLSCSTDRDVYGLTRHQTGTKTTNHGFVGGLGHQTDDETGLVYMRARYYDPATGRFVSEDSKQDGPNWLIYCADNPVNGIDPSGNILILDIAASSGVECAADGEAAGEALGILARTSKQLSELEELSNTVIELETQLDEIGNKGLLDKIELLGRDPKNWYKAYQYFYTGAEGGFKTIEIHSFVEVEGDVIRALLEGDTTPWFTVGS